MLNGSGYAAGNIQAGRHNLSGLPHLVGVGPPAFVHSSPGSAHSAAKCIGQFFDDGIIRSAHAPAAGNHNVSFGKIDLAGFHVLFDQLDRWFRQGHIYFLDRC